MNGHRYGDNDDFGFTRKAREYFVEFLRDDTALLSDDFEIDGFATLYGIEDDEL